MICGTILMLMLCDTGPFNSKACCAGRECISGETNCFDPYRYYGDGTKFFFVAAVGCIVIVCLVTERWLLSREAARQTGDADAPTARYSSRRLQK